MTKSDETVQVRSGSGNRRGGSRSGSSRRDGKTGSRSANRSRADGKALSVELRDTVQQNLDRAVYIVFDIETTGGNPERNGITEICALKIQNGTIIDRFYTLVNPMIPIPPIVRRMTGITNQLVKDAPVIDEIYADFAEFIGEHILVSHNTIGDLIFLRHFAKDTIGRDLKNFFLCTHLLVEKLVHDAPDKSLKGLSKHFNLAGAEFHRAEADAIQTWELFKVLLRKLKDRGVTRVEHAIRLQGDLDSALRLGWAISKEKLTELPGTTGVFYLYDHERRLLFLSSALAINKEVAKFQHHELIPRQILKLALRSYDLQSTRMPSMLAAMLAECDGREKHNIQADPSLFHQRQVQVIGIYEDRGESMRIAVGPMEPGLRYAFGPVKDRKRAMDFLEDLAEILGEKTTRTGMLVSPDNQSVVVNLLSGTLSEFQRRIEKRLWGLRVMFWRREAAAEQLRRLDAIASLMGLSSPGVSCWRNVASLHGVIVVPDEGTAHWQVHTIVGGLSVGVHQVRGDWQQRLRVGGVGKRLLQRLEKDIKQSHGPTPYTTGDIGRMNALLWWLQYGKAKDHGHYLTVEEFTQLLAVKTRRGKGAAAIEDLANEDQKS